MRLMTAKEAGRALRVSPDTVRAMLARGDLEGFVSGKVTRVTVRSVERLLGVPLPEAEPA